MDLGGAGCEGSVFFLPTTKPELGRNRRCGMLEHLLVLGNPLVSIPLMRLGSMERYVS